MLSLKKMLACGSTVAVVLAASSAFAADVVTAPTPTVAAPAPTPVAPTPVAVAPRPATPTVSVTVPVGTRPAPSPTPTASTTPTGGHETWGSRDGGAFASLPPGEQKIAVALHDAELRSGRHHVWSLDRIAAAHEHEGWGQVFHQMKADGLVHAKNLGQVIRAEHHPMTASAMHHHHAGITTAGAGMGSHHHHHDVAITTASGTTAGTGTMGHHGHHTVSSPSTAGGGMHQQHIRHVADARPVSTTSAPSHHFR